MRRPSLSRAGLLAGLALLVAFAGCRSDPETDARESRAGGPQPEAAAAPQPAATGTPRQRPVSPTPRGYSGPLPPLPSVPYPPARPIEVTRAVYAFAARNPEVLQYVPCFCGCEHHGHQGNDDCFVSARGADGKPRWEMHGYV